LPIGLPKGEEVPKFTTTTARRRVSVRGSRRTLKGLAREDCYLHLEKGD
jgi:hypothetical protein